MTHYIRRGSHGAALFTACFLHFLQVSSNRPDPSHQSQARQKQKLLSALFQYMEHLSAVSILIQF